MIAKDKTVLRFILLYLLLSILVFSSVATAEDNFISDPDAVEDVADSVFMLEVYDRSGSRVAIGSGFVAFESDLLVTNFHVIEEGEYVVAISDDSQRYVLNQVCVYSQAIDLAILHFSDHMNTKPLELDTESTLKRSQTVMAIGSPAGLRDTISIGNISAFFDQDGRDWIQFTAPISPGSSGGAKSRAWS